LQSRVAKQAFQVAIGDVEYDWWWASGKLAVAIPLSKAGISRFQGAGIGGVGVYAIKLQSRLVKQAFQAQIITSNETIDISYSICCNPA